MNRQYKRIHTELGYIEARRDAIFLDSFEQKGNNLCIKGEINSIMCEKKSDKYEWYKYQLNISGVKNYQAMGIEEFYSKEIPTISAFSEVVKDNIDCNKAKTIIIETYDWAYIINCTIFEFVITGQR